MYGSLPATDRGAQSNGGGGSEHTALLGGCVAQEEDSCFVGWDLARRERRCLDHSRVASRALCTCSAARAGVHTRQGQPVCVCACHPSVPGQRP